MERERVCVRETKRDHRDRQTEITACKRERERERERERVRDRQRERESAQ